MKVYASYLDIPLPERKNRVITIGNFDGCHIGHRALFNATVARASEIKGFSLVISFNTHTHRDPGEGVLLDLATKTEILNKLGVDIFLCQPFDRTFSALEPGTFIENILVDRLGGETIVVGTDFHFGYRGKGTVASLREYANLRKISLIVIDPILDDGEVVSSTLVRQMLDRGDLDRVTRLLLRPYEIGGKVIRGEGRGRALGFPTLNVRMESYIHPRFGVYAGFTKIDGQLIDSIAYVGSRPTFAGRQPLLEVHLLDRNLDLYDRPISFSFLRFIRPDRRFDSKAALVAQIDEDIVQTKTYLMTLDKGHF